MKSEWGSGGNANDSIENCDWRRARILVFDLNVYIYIYMCVYAFLLMRLVSLTFLVCDVSPM